MICQIQNTQNRLIINTEYLDTFLKETSFLHDKVVKVNSDIGLYKLLVSDNQKKFLENIDLERKIFYLKSLQQDIAKTYSTYIQKFLYLIKKECKDLLWPIDRSYSNSEEVSLFIDTYKVNEAVTATKSYTFTKDGQQKTETYTYSELYKDILRICDELTNFIEKQIQSQHTT